MKQTIQVHRLTKPTGLTRHILSLVGLLMLGLSATAYAHRGAVNEADPCNVKLGYERVHFTAYLPTLTKSQEYCQSIPQVGLTNLVFDYEGKSLRNVTVEFEVTKEPEGTRVFYQEPKMIKTGTFNSTIDFSKYGAGNYLSHVTIVHNDKRLDSHIPFSVGLGEEYKMSGLVKFLLLAAGIVVSFVLVILYLKAKDKKALKDEPLDL